MSAFKDNNNPFVKQQFRMIGKVIYVNLFGYFFKHNMIAIQAKTDHPNIKSQFMGGIYASIDKFPTKDREYFERKMESGEVIDVVVEQHMFGNPFKGRFFNPLYITKVNEPDTRNKSD